MTTSTAAPAPQAAARSRSTNLLRVLSLLLVVAGVVISGYLSYTELTSTPIACPKTDAADGVPAVNCDVVQSSAYSKLANIPVAYLGLISYLVMGALLLLEDRTALLQTYGLTLLFGITLFAFMYSMWLVYVQAAILQSFCPWCLAHEAVMTVLFLLTAVRFWRSMRTV
jgi:uncharacterized membrane protein